MNLTKKNLLLVITMACSLFLTSCATDSKKDSGADSAITDAAENLTLELNGSSDDNTAGPLQTVFFAFNSSGLTAAGKETLEQNATWLKGIESVDIQIEGHADERGGHQFNLALGERRAASVKSFLEALGVNANRVSIVSYGKEKPVSFGHDETAWSKNRRANFVITAK